MRSLQERKQYYTEQAKTIKDNFQANHPDYVYTRRSSKKRALVDVEAGSSKKFKGSDAVSEGPRYFLSFFLLSFHLYEVAD